MLLILGGLGAPIYDDAGHIGLMLIAARPVMRTSTGLWTWRILASSVQTSTPMTCSGTPAILTSMA